MVAHSRQSVAESSFIFLVPTGLTHWQIVWVKPLGDEDHDAEEAEESRGGALDGPVRPLTLGFEAEASAQFFKGDLNIPTQTEPDDDLLGGSLSIGAEEGGRFEAVFKTADQDPAQRHRVLAWGVPQRYPRDEFDLVLFTIQDHLELMPDRLRVYQLLREFGLAVTFLGLRAAFTLGLWAGKVKQTGIQP